MLGNASKAMGVDTLELDSLLRRRPERQPRAEQQRQPAVADGGANDYVRAIDFTQPASRATGVTYAVPGDRRRRGAGAVPAEHHAAEHGWAQQLEIWITPWGFLKGAAANNATAQAQTVGGKRYQVVTWMTPQIKSPGGQPYKVVGYINAQNLVEKVQTWLENPIFGDMLVEAEYTQYRDGPNGLKFPADIVQKRGGWPTFEAQILGAHREPREHPAAVDAARRAAAALAAPAARRRRLPAAAGPTSEKLADGVFRINGAYNALAVEFADHIVLFEPGPQNEARAQAIIAEAKKVIPNKPIRYGVISHHHFDHTSGLPAVVAEGITIVTPEVNRAFLLNALSARRARSRRIRMSKSGKKPVIEGFTGDKRVFQDATRTLRSARDQGPAARRRPAWSVICRRKKSSSTPTCSICRRPTPVPDPPCRHDGVCGQHRAAEAGCGPHHVGALAEWIG